MLINELAKPFYSKLNLSIKDKRKLRCSQPQSQFFSFSLQKIYLSSFSDNYIFIYINFAKVTLTRALVREREGEDEDYS